MFRLIFILSVALIHVSQSSFVQAQNVSSSKKWPELARSIFKKLEDQRLFHGAAIVMVGDRMIYEGATGTADVSTKKPNTLDTKFRLCSLTKLFTQVVVMRLVEQGKLDLDEPISTYRPNFDPKIGEKVTLRHLLRMTSGLPRELAERSEDSGVKFDEHGMAGPFLDALKLELEFPPGSRRRYSNVGYWIAGAVIESATNKTFEESVQELILTPLGMDDSGFGQDELGVNGHARGHETNGELIEPFPISPRFTSGSMYSTVVDMQKFARSFWTDELLNKQSKKEIFREFGNGPGHRTKKGGRLLQMGGHVPGFSNMFVLHIDEGYTLISLNNTNFEEMNAVWEGTFNVIKMLRGDLDTPTDKGPGQPRSLRVKSAKNGLPNTKIVQTAKKLLEAIASKDEAAIKRWHHTYRPTLGEKKIDQLSSDLAKMADNLGGFETATYLDRSKTELVVGVRGKKPYDMLFEFTAATSNAERIEELEIGEIWRHNGWRLLKVRPTGPCIESAMVWDPARKVFVLHSGRNRNWEMLAETWEWAPGAAEWSRVVGKDTRNPGQRMMHAMVWDSKRERMLLFGGSREEDYLNDTWAYDSRTRAWEQLQTNNNPPGRAQHGMVYDPERNEILLFGGRGSEARPLNDTWVLDLDTLKWNLLPSQKGGSHPQARDHVQMARDPLSGITVLRGHSLGRGLADETWHFNSESRSWTLMEIERQPNGADHGMFCAVEAAEGFLFLTGESDMQTWLYTPRTKTWRQLEPGGQLPESPFDHGQVASDGRDFYVFGGFGGEEVREDAGVKPRGALWVLPIDTRSKR